MRFVQTLLALCGPTTVSGLIIAVFIWIAIESHPGWPFTHIREETLETGASAVSDAPPIADSYPATAVAGIVLVRLVAASSQHRLPRPIYGRLRAAVNSMQ
jgi:hypothetical protein